MQHISEHFVFCSCTTQSPQSAPLYSKWSLGCSHASAGVDAHIDPAGRTAFLREFPENSERPNGPEEYADFAVIFGEFVTFQRADVGSAPTAECAGAFENQDSPELHLQDAHS